MKKLYSMVFLGMVLGLLVFSSLALAVNGHASDSAKRVTAKDIADIQAGKRKAFVDGKLVEARIVFHHRPGHNGGPGGGGEPGGGGSKCYGVLAKGAKWKSVEPYILDTTNSDGMSDNFVRSVTATSFGTWNAVGFSIFGTEDIGEVVDGPDTNSPDDKNEVMFGSIDSPGAIGVTIVWGIFGGPPQGREIIEYDTVFEDADYEWGDATIDDTLMDYQSIATHEFGHGAGLDDLYTPDCSQQTMYGYGAEGETYARTLEVGDIAGINSLYG